MVYQETLRPIQNEFVVGFHENVLSNLLTLNQMMNMIILLQRKQVKFTINSANHIYTQNNLTHVFKSIVFKGE